MHIWQIEYDLVCCYFSLNKMSESKWLFKTISYFPGGPVLKIHRSRVQSLVRNLRFHMPHSLATKKSANGYLN